MDALGGAVGKVGLCGRLPALRNVERDMGVVEGGWMWGRVEQWRVIR